MKLLVTGGAGFIGSNFVRHALAEHPAYDVVVLDLFTYAGNRANLASVAASPRLSIVEGDVCDREKVARTANGCDAIVHFAAETHVDRSITDAGKFVQTDVYGTWVLLEEARAARERGREVRFVHISTDEVYGDAGREPSLETSPLMPRSPYAASKAGGDRLVFSYWTTYELPVVITRCTNNYGPFQHPEKLIPLFVTNALTDQPMPVYGHGKNTREWIHVSDHVRALDVLLHRDDVFGEAFNVGSGEELSVLEVTDAILAATGRSASLLKHVADRPGHVVRHAVTSEKIRRAVGWKARVPFREGIADTVAWYRDNRSWWEAIRSGEFREYYKKHYGFELASSGRGGKARA